MFGLAESLYVTSQYDGPAKHRRRLLGRFRSCHVGQPVGRSSRNFISKHSFQGSSITTFLTHAEHGKWQGVDSSLLVFESSFLAKRRSRFKEVTVTVDFTPKVSLPEIVAWCPKHAMGDDSISKHTKGSGGAIGLVQSIGVISSVSATRTIETQKISRVEIKSAPNGDPDTGKIHSISWRVTENNARGGIPYIVTLGLILKNRGPDKFGVRVSFDVQLSTWNPLLWWGLRIRDKPRTIRTENSVGEPVEHLQDMENVDLEALIPLPDRV